MDCSLSGSSVHGIFQAIILEQVAISYFKSSSHYRIKPTLLVSPALAGGSFTAELPGKPEYREGTINHMQIFHCWGRGCP